MQKLQERRACLGSFDVWAEVSRWISSVSSRKCVLWAHRCSVGCDSLRRLGALSEVSRSGLSVFRQEGIMEASGCSVGGESLRHLDVRSIASVGAGHSVRGESLGPVSVVACLRSLVLESCSFSRKCVAMSSLRRDSRSISSLLAVSPSSSSLLLLSLNVAPRREEA